jgi:hypothetical protein
VEPIIEELLGSEEPSVRWRVRVGVLGEDPDSPAIRRLGQQIRDSARVRAILTGRGPDGRIVDPAHVYSKWVGAHWVLAALADLGHPSGDRSLTPLRDQVLDTWLDRYHRAEVEAANERAAARAWAVPVVQGRHRQHASQHGNALRAAVALGLADDRCTALAELLRRWQWPDGGWNCDRRPKADTSSLHETLLAMRGLAAYAAATGDADAGAAAQRAAEVFLTRRLYRRRGTGEVIHPDMIRLHYPRYWHYDMLGGLVGMVEVGTIADKRCADALDLLESQRLPDGGWPGQHRYYRVGGTGTGRERVDWGGPGLGRHNPWVTAEALAVLRAAGRLACEA